MTATDDELPEEVVVAEDRTHLRLVWDNGRTASFRSAALRDACRCAWCTRDRILDHRRGPYEEVSLVGVDVLGSHGLHLKFSDGHDRGIYPWAYLRDLWTIGSPDAAGSVAVAASPIQIGSNQ